MPITSCALFSENYSDEFTINEAAIIQIHSSRVNFTRDGQTSLKHESFLDYLNTKTLLILDDMASPLYFFK